jgi:hypothetical protein
MRWGSVCRLPAQGTPWAAVTAPKERGSRWGSAAKNQVVNVDLIHPEGAWFSMGERGAASRAWRDALRRVRKSAQGGRESRPRPSVTLHARGLPRAPWRTGAADGRQRGKTHESRHHPSTRQLAPPGDGDGPAHRLPLYEAALSLAETFHLHLQPNREEATRNPKPPNS